MRGGKSIRSKLGAEVWGRLCRRTRASTEARGEAALEDQCGFWQGSGAIRHA